MGICRVVTVIFLAAYVIALALLGIGTFGLFGQEEDPLAGVFVVLLGLPWNRFFDGASDAALPWIAMAAPAVNLLLLVGICRTLRKRRT